MVHKVNEHNPSCAAIRHGGGFAQAKAWQTVGNAKTSYLYII
jgi:hypothetical protein